MDYFLARYYSNAQGRFTSSDPLLGDIANPQTLNRYSYTISNPLRYIDPTGKFILPLQQEQPIKEVQQSVSSSVEKTARDIVVIEAKIPGPVIVETAVKAVTTAVQIYNGIKHIISPSADPKGTSETADFSGGGASDEFAPRQVIFDTNIVLGP